MTENLNLAFQLLFIGMISVFVILAIVVNLGRLLIYIVNKYYPEAPKKGNKISSQLISNKKIAVLTSVVDQVTHNQGVIKSITKY